jgi:hypothetical protein
VQHNAACNVQDVNQVTDRDQVRQAQVTCAQFIVLHRRAADDDATHGTQLAEALRKLCACILDLRHSTMRQDTFTMSTQLQMVTRSNKRRSHVCTGYNLAQGAADDDAAHCAQLAETLR